MVRISTIVGFRGFTGDRFRKEEVEEIAEYMGIGFPEEEEITKWELQAAISDECGLSFPRSQTGRRFSLQHLRAIYQELENDDIPRHSFPEDERVVRYKNSHNVDKVYHEPDKNDLPACWGKANEENWIVARQSALTTYKKCPRCFGGTNE